MESPQAEKQERLASLDVLRGFDIFVLVCAGPLLLKFLQLVLPAKSSFTESVIYQFGHHWTGFTCWDMIMPLFLFMAGASMPFAFAKYRAKDTPWQLAWRIVRRVVLLWILGMLVQGGLRGLRWHDIAFYTNTLQSIAAGYLITAIIMLCCKTWKAQIACGVGLMLVYWIPMTFCGDWLPLMGDQTWGPLAHFSDYFKIPGNFAEKLDCAVFGRFTDKLSWDAQGNWHFKPYHYSWLWSSLTFGVTVLLGSFAGRIVREGEADRKRTSLKLTCVGLGLLVGAWLWHFQMPINKHLWTCSMTLLAGGWSFLLLALFYWWIDCRRHTRGVTWLKFYGMNCILAYMVGEAGDLTSLPRSYLYGFEQYLGGNWYPLLISAAACFILFAFLWLMYRCKVFLRV